jgi:hypothetical protein
MATGKMRIAFLATTVFFGGCELAIAQGKSVKLSAGLEASLGFVGRDSKGERLTITLKLLNKSATAVHVVMDRGALAVDNAGTAYKVVSSSGVALCPKSKYGGFSITQCLGKEEDNFAPIESFTQIDPDSETTITFAFNTENNDRGTGTLASFAATLVYRVVRDPLADETLPEAERRKGLRTLNISIPEHPITQGK